MKPLPLYFDISLRLAISLLLLICLFDMPYGYYQLVRYIAATSFLVLGLTLPDSKQATVQKIVLISLAVLFQPLIKIALGRTMWNIVDVVVAVALIISAFYLYRDK